MSDEIKTGPVDLLDGTEEVMINIEIYNKLKEKYDELKVENVGYSEKCKELVCDIWKLDYELQKLKENYDELYDELKENYKDSTKNINKYGMCIDILTRKNTELENKLTFAVESLNNVQNSSASALVKLNSQLAFYDIASLKIKISD